MVLLTISEIHFAKRTIEARIEWIKDNKQDASEEEGELQNLCSILNKLESLRIGLNEEEQL
jgi:hypothetical protein